MSDRLYVATRKGLFTLQRGADGKWTIRDAAFLGDNVPMVLADSRDGALYAALSHGHFGSKLHRSTDGGGSWEEITTPSYPEKPADVEDVVSPMQNKPVPWRLELIWSLEAGLADQPGRLWCGTIPGGLFRSDDHGRSWSLVRPLWDHPGRREWFGGGYDYPGIHSICLDPRDGRRVIVGVSCGGVWVTEYTLGYVWYFPEGGGDPQLAIDTNTFWIPNLHWGNGIGGWDANTLYVQDRFTDELLAVPTGIPGSPVALQPE